MYLPHVLHAEQRRRAAWGLLRQPNVPDLAGAVDLVVQQHLHHKLDRSERLGCDLVSSTSRWGTCTPHALRRRAPREPARDRTRLMRTTHLNFVGIARGLLCGANGEGINDQADSPLRSRVADVDREVHAPAFTERAAVRKGRPAGLEVEVCITRMRPARNDTRHLDARGSSPQSRHLSSPRTPAAASTAAARNRL